MSNIKVEMFSISDFGHFCRTCSAETQLQSLFDNIETLSMLKSFTQMQFSKTDELPDKICATCLSKIHECFHFINNCKIVDEGFRKCLHDPQNQLEQKASELHSSIEIKEEEEEEEVVENEPENIKLIKTNESEFYILEWGGENGQQQVEKHFKISGNNNSIAIEQETILRIKTANRKRRLRIHQFDEQETHRARAKLTLPPHENPTAHLIREINYRRAFARDQMRKLRSRSKITAAEIAEHRAEASERMRKVRSRFQTRQLKQYRPMYRKNKSIPMPIGTKP